MTAVLLTNGFYILFPIVIIYLCTTYPVLDKIGMIILCYAVGLILGNIHILPQEILASQETLGFLFINGLAKDSWKLVGMAVGVYTGGTPNLASIKTALEVDPTIFITFHTYDIVITLFFIIFFITIAQSVCNLFLPRFTPLDKAAGTDILHSEGMDSYKGILQANILIKLLGALVLSAIIVGAALAISRLFPREYATSMTILSITSMGIGCSFIPAIRNIAKTFQLGMYIIMIFCLVVSSMSNFSQLAHLNMPILMYVGFSVFGSLFLHAIFLAYPWPILSNP